MSGRHQRGVEQRAQNEADRQIARQERSRHAQREHRQTDQPVADVSRNEQAQVESPNASELSTMKFVNCENNSETV